LLDSGRLAGFSHIFINGLGLLSDEETNRPNSCRWRLVLESGGAIDSMTIVFAEALGCNGILIKLDLVPVWSARTRSRTSTIKNENDCSMCELAKLRSSLLLRWVATNN
jgi:hypothetical protein